MMRVYSFLFCFCWLWWAAAGQSQPFWSENFSAGFPAGWTTGDLSPNAQKCHWTWCSNPEKGDDEYGCPEIWNTSSNQQKPFDAATATTGFMVMDSDDCGELPHPHQSILTTAAINCAGKSEVWLQFQTHIGVYEFNADDNAVLQVSTDLTQWTTFKVFSGLTTNVRWSENPEIPIINISSVAANQPTVYLRWFWRGNWEYHWSIDDVELHASNPTPANDLALADYFYPVSSFAQPKSQIATDTMAFAVWISNKGLQEQAQVVLKVVVENVSGVVFHADSILLPSVSTAVKEVQHRFPKVFVPQLPEGRYRIVYTLGNHLPDGRPADNKIEKTFVVTTAHFAKEEKPEQAYRPSSSSMTDTWYVGNYYRMGSQTFERYKAVSAEFAFTTDADEVKINQVRATIFLLKAKDHIDDELSNLDDNDFFESFEWIGLGEYVAPTNLEDNFSIQQVDLLDFNTSKVGVQLEPRGKYLLAIGYAAPYNKVYHAFNNDVDYYFTSTLIYTSRFGSFGSDVNAVLRMNVSLTVTTDEKALPDGVFTLAPNPANDFVRLKTDFKYPTDATLTLAQPDGRVVAIYEKKLLLQDEIWMSTAHLPAGIYLARIATADGTKTLQFVVAH